eukprot:TRINITY_DN5146_c0_g1_i1.p1 TRINITY_DN5146_c0_g1~~TRINITY_DN5146_c0_g1_i1.p1  ORF type:complete len:459 (+),score=42.31 TRINITY_DN5146_c0_g1_i1:36-1412(+)
MALDIILDGYRFFKDRPKLQLSLLFCCCFLIYGYILGLFGPSIPFLREATGTTLEQQSVLVTVRAIGFFSGSGLAGFVFDKLPGNNVLSAVLLAGLIGVIALPLTASVYAEGAIMLGFGALMGSIDAGCNALIAFLHGDECDPYYHAMHLLFTSGAAISPLVLEVVLSAGQSFKYAWWLIGIVMICAAVLLPSYDSPKAPDSHSSQTDADTSDVITDHTASSTRSVLSFLDDPVRHRWWCACVAASFLLVYYGCEVAFGSLLTSYVRLQRLGSPSQANLMTFSFWASQSCGLACSIFISHRKVQPKFMLFGNLVLMGSGLGLLWIFRSDLVGSWIAAIVFGLGVSSGFPTMINLLQTFTEITGKVSSLISVASAVGEMTIPAMIGSRMENAGHSPSIMILILGVGFIIQAVIYAVLVGTARPKPLREIGILVATPGLEDSSKDTTEASYQENARFIDW